MTSDLLADAARGGELVGDRTVGVAESCTAGLVAQALASAEGSMNWFRGGIVAYQRQVKHKVLGVGPGPVVTEQVAKEMAEGAARLLDADVAVATTGAAGPDPLDGAPPGTVIVAIWTERSASATVCHFEGSPSEVCAAAARAAIEMLLDCLRV
jgi:nicotinamide-nucleotide amidase